MKSTNNKGGTLKHLKKIVQSYLGWMVLSFIEKMWEITVWDTINCQSNVQNNGSTWGEDEKLVVTTFLKLSGTWGEY